MSISRFGVRHPVPVNLLMAATLIAGIYCGVSLRREFFPESAPDQVAVTLIYPGATAEEIEETLAVKVEDKLANLDEVEKLSTTLSEGGGGINVEIREGVDPDKALDEIDRAIDTLTDLPEEAEEIKTTLLEARLPVIRVMVYGDLDEAVIKQAIRSVRDDLQTLPGMGELIMSGVRDDEIRVDVRRGALVQYGVSLPQVAATVRGEMIEVPGGTVRGDTGNVKVRTIGVEEKAERIRAIEVVTTPDGGAVKLDDIATVRSSFVDEQQGLRFQGKPAAMLIAFAVGDQDIVEIAEMVRAYVDGRNRVPLDLRLSEYVRDSKREKAWELGVNSTRPLPGGAGIGTSGDLARFVEGRLDLLTRNAIYGAMLVFATLLFILNWRVAVWVGIGLLIAISGTLLLMYTFDITLNLLTMFGLIVVLGLLVDDAIVVAENIQARHDRGEPTIDAAIKGAEQVLWPVTATVLTSVVAFLPLTFVKGHIGDLLGALPMVVACALLMSLFESLLILPSHMAHSIRRDDESEPGRIGRMLRRYETKRDDYIFRRVLPAYTKVLETLLNMRYLTITIAVAILVGAAGLVAGGRLEFEFLSSNDSETVVVDLRMPIGTPIDRTNALVQRIEEAAGAQVEVKSVASGLGRSDNIDTGQADAVATHVAQMFIELYNVEDRERQSSEVVASIRTALADDLDEIDRISFTEISGGPGGKAISMEFRGTNDARVMAAANQFKTMLMHYEGVTDISDNNDTGQMELQFNLRPGARAMGFTREDVALQIRAALFGIDAHVFAAKQEDIDVRVRMDETSRQSLYAVQNSWLVSPAGQSVPLQEVVEVRETTSYATVKRIDRQRAVLVTADTLPGVSPETIFEELDVDGLRASFHDVNIDIAGRQQQMADAFGSLPLGFGAALILIYFILAWLFAHYFQPLVVLTGVPFAIVGVLMGHWILGYDLTFLSVIGFVALSGIVVNDSLIYVEFYNAQRKAGKSVHDSLIAAGRARLRAILLTTITTVLGLTPLILEQSFQAQFLVPMAIAIAAGLISATFLILLVMPCMMFVMDDIRRLAYLLWFGNRMPREADIELPRD